MSGGDERVTARSGRLPLRISQMWPTPDAHQYVACVIVPDGAECLTTEQVDDVIRRLRECQQRARKGR